MAYCSYCGKQLVENASFCSECGAPVLGHAAASAPNSGAAPFTPTPPVERDSKSIGWWFLGFFLPLVGLILFLVWKDDTPIRAKRCGWGALFSVIAVVAFYAILFLFAIGIAILSVALI